MAGVPTGDQLEEPFENLEAESDALAKATPELEPVVDALLKYTELVLRSFYRSCRWRQLRSPYAR